MSKKRILVLIDPGHGGADPGAVAQGFGFREKDLTLSISKRIEATLNGEYEVDVRLTRSTDTTLNLKARTDLANQLNADYFLSVHVNAGGGTGYEDFIFINLSDSSGTAKMRDILHAEIMKVLEKYAIRNRGKKKANFHVLRETRMSAALTENLFIDNANDQKLLRNTSFLNDIADAHAHGIARALGLTKKPKPVSTPKPNVTPGGQVGLHRVIVDGTQIGAWGNQSYLLRNIEKAIEGGAKEIRVQKV